jgi:allene oxide cyclase
MSCELVLGGYMQGPFANYQDTLMSITGGVGFFREARGVVRLHNICLFKFFYTFTLTGIPELPRHVTALVVPPTESAAAIPEAVACHSLFTLPN